jgi:hypothetical protein
MNMQPDLVRSPKERIRELRVIYTNREEGWSIAEIDWYHRSDDEWRWRVGMRWDGEEGELGNPQSSGHPTWFVVPEGEISDIILERGRALARERDPNA